MKIRPVTQVSEKERDYRFDNIKFILIVLVVGGHIMELFKGVDIPYKIIYGFHMPAFIFVSGRFARFDAKKVLCKLVIPYFIFQLIYQIFSGVVLKGSSPEIQFTTPYWILWYLLAIIAYYCLIPILPKRENKIPAVALITIAFIAGLLTGYISSVGYYLSLSRIIVFLPFFLLGYYSSFLEKGKIIPSLLSRKIYIPLAIAFAIMGSYVIVKLNIPKRILYGSYDYESGKGNLWMRLIIYMVALIWIWMLRIVVSDKKIPFITRIGQNTLVIFLMHGFVVKLLKKYEVFHYQLGGNIILMVISVLAIIIVFGMPWADWLRGSNKGKNK